jgi:hypothetical protein
MRKILALRHDQPSLTHKVDLYFLLWLLLCALYLTVNAQFLIADKSPPLDQRTLFGFSQISRLGVETIVYGTLIALVLLGICRCYPALWQQISEKAKRLFCSNGSNYSA